MNLTTRINLILGATFLLGLALVIVVVPYALPAELARNSFAGFVVSMAVIFLLLVVVINIVIRRLVLKPVSQVIRMADEISDGNLRNPEIKVTGNDEIAEMLRAFNRMRRSMIKLAQMMQRLKAQGNIKT
ncbi:MAG: HAMP domain-containing protein [Gammaproteobacteria bacterium]|jgi:protein-histidine pros-kinase|nr:HAMP domain-containing protein [Gammaproteobacteria bacterium]